MNFKRYEFETNNDVIIFDPIQASNDIIDDLKRILETKKIKFTCNSCSKITNLLDKSLIILNNSTNYMKNNALALFILYRNRNF